MTDALSPSFDRRPETSRYSRLECERRFLLERVPAAAHSAVEITDRYLDGTTLRLREMRPRHGTRTYKLGQKVRSQPDDPSVVHITSIYLTADEHAALAALPAAVLRKTRFNLDHDGHALAIDFFHDHLAGLILAEASFDDEEAMRAFPAPDFTTVEVTDDERYTGGALARTGAESLPALLQDARQPVEWPRWHDAYADPDSPLSRRLLVVQDQIRHALDTAPGASVRLVSLCAGEGRDVLPVLAKHPRRDEITARLVEYDAAIADRARAQCTDLGLPQVEIVTSDAAEASACEGAVPAHLVMVCGVFGNITDDDVRHTISRLPMLCAPGATVIWTRHRLAPDLTPSIRQWFTEYGFEEIVFESPGEGAFGVGSHRLLADPAPLDPAVRFFTFIR